MPPRPKTEEEILNEREIILNNALVLIDQKGYMGLTMRDLAKLCDFSPTKIYYYFANKEDIVMNIMQRGYELLIKLTTSALEKETTLKGRAECVCVELFSFGLKNEKYFNLMFGFGVPHTTDFLTDSALVDKAKTFKAIALSYYGLFSNTLNEYATSNDIHLKDLELLTLFSNVFGVLELNSAKIIQELNVDINELFKVSLSAIISSLENK